MTSLLYHTTEELKKYVEELIIIAIEHKIPKEEIIALYELSQKGRKDEIRQRLSHKILVSEVTGKTLMSSSFSEKLRLFSSELKKDDKLTQDYGTDDIISHHQYHYDTYPIQLMLECFLILYDDRRNAYLQKHYIAAASSSSKKHSSKIVDAEKEEEDL